MVRSKLNSIKMSASMFALSIVTMLSQAPLVHADPATDASKQALCDGAGLTGADCGGGGAGLGDIFSNILSILSIIIGIAAVIVIIVAGLKYVTSGGDASKVSSAKSTLIYALIGLVVAALAQVMVRFVLSKT